MGLMYPGVLWGLFVLVVPVLIHLLRLRRYRVIFFSDTERLIQAKQETQRRSKLKHLILLLLRMMALSAIVLAFARPYLADQAMQFTSQAKNQLIFLYIDNSLSMSATVGYHSKLDEARDKAIQIIQAFGQTYQYIILTNVASPSDFLPVNSSQALQKIYDIQIVPYQRSLVQILDLVPEILKHTYTEKALLFVISDFQKHFFRGLDVSRQNSVYITFVPVVFQEFMNVSVDTVIAETPYILPGKEVAMKVVVKNHGTEDQEGLPVELYIDGVRKSFAVLTVHAGQTADAELRFMVHQNGPIEGKIVCQDQSLTFDDTLYFSFMSQESIVVGVVHDRNQALRSFRAILSDEPAIQFYEKNINQLQQKDLNHTRLLVLDAPSKINTLHIDLLKRYVEEGGQLVLIPPEPEVLSDVNNLLAILGVGRYGEQVQATLLISGIVSEHPVFSGVFESLPQDKEVPVVQKYYTFVSSGRYQREILKLQNGEPFLFEIRSGKGKVYVFTSCFKSDWTDFHIHSLFVPVMLQIAFLSATSYTALYYLSDDRPISFILDEIDKEHRYRLIRHNGAFQAIIPFRFDGKLAYFYLHPAVQKSGNYRIMQGEKVVGVVGVNYPREESSLDFLGEQELDSLLQRHQHLSGQLLNDETRIDQYVSGMMQGKQLWRWFVILAICCLLSEVMILRFWR